MYYLLPVFFYNQCVNVYVYSWYTGLYLPFNHLLFKYHLSVNSTRLEYGTLKTLPMVLLCQMYLMDVNFLVPLMYL